MAFAVDCSGTMAWIFSDEASAGTAVVARDTGLGATNFSTGSWSRGA